MFRFGILGVPFLSFRVRKAGLLSNGASFGQCVDLLD